MQTCNRSSQATVIGEGVQKYLNLFGTPSDLRGYVNTHVITYFWSNVMPKSVVKTSKNKTKALLLEHFTIVPKWKFCFVANYMYCQSNTYDLI